jgi:hypothetical protein
MGFSETLSNRGPGFIGAIIAVFVLLGFGALYMLVFDERLQGGERTIESVIRDQGVEISSRQDEIESYQRQLADAERLKAVSKEADELEASYKLGAKKVAELTATKEQATAAAESATAALEKYKDEYRASEWAAAKGTKLPDITTADGNVYTNVMISEVSHRGIRITHSSGSKTIPPQALPPEIQDRFQFSEEKKAELIKAEMADANLHSESVEISTRAQDAANKLRKAGQLKDQITELKFAVRQMNRNRSEIKSAVRRLRSTISRERSGKGISNAPAMEKQLQEMEAAEKLSGNNIPEKEQQIHENEKEMVKLTREAKELENEIRIIKDQLEKKKQATTQP